MLSLRSFLALCLVTLGAVIAAVLVSGESGAIPGSGQPLFKDLLSRLNDVKEVQVETGPERFVLKRGAGGWAVPDKAEYPADADKVHQLLVGAAGLHRVEPKTSDPERYSKLGLAENGEGSATPTVFRLKSAGDATLAALIVGNSAPAKGDPEMSELYVRLPDEPRVWLVEGKLPRGNTLSEWLDRKVAGIDRSRVREVKVTHGSGEVVNVMRKSPAEDDFRLAGAPLGKTVDGQWKLNDIGRLFASLELDDVRPKAEAPVKGEPDYVVTMRTYDGLVVNMKIFKHDERAFGVLRAEFQPQASESDSSSEATTLPLDADKFRAEAEKLNAKWARWAYVLPGHKLDALARTQSELLKDLSEDKKPDQG